MTNGFESRLEGPLMAPLCNNTLTTQAFLLGDLLIFHAEHWCTMKMMTPEGSDGIDSCDAASGSGSHIFLVFLCVCVCSVAVAYLAGCWQRSLVVGCCNLILDFFPWAFFSFLCPVSQMTNPSSTETPLLPQTHRAIWEVLFSQTCK